MLVERETDVIMWLVPYLQVTFVSSLQSHDDFHPHETLIVYSYEICDSPLITVILMLALLGALLELIVCFLEPFNFSES